MTGVKIVVAVLLSAAIVRAQQIPPETALPVVLDSTLDVNKVKSGQPISATIAQNVPLPSGAKIRDRSHVNGRVLQVGKNPDGSSYLRLRFDQVHAYGRDIAVTTSLRAVASPWEVQEAQLPKYSPGRRGESAANLTTIQVGGDVVYRGGGHVMHYDQVVGDPVYGGGVLAELTSEPESGCASGSGQLRLALWVFASSACGAYGFLDDLDIAHAGDANPIGEIALQSKTGVRVPTGSAMLLITTEAPQLHP
jgi:hypothetical protein